MAEKKRTGTVTWILMGILILSLGGFGITQFGQSAQTVASVGKVDIGANEYARAVEGQMRAFEQQTNQPVTFQTAQALGLDRIALGQLVTAAAIENEAARIGVSAGDSLVGEELRRVPAFQNTAGEFDREAYQNALRQNGLTVRDFEDDVRADLASGMLRSSVAAGITVPDVFVDTLFNHARETRDVTWARLTAADLDGAIDEPSDDALASYHSENAAAFTRPETKTIRYAWLTPDLLAPEIEVDDEQVRALYEQRIVEFVREERRLVERLVYPTEEGAQAAKDAIDAGEGSFDDEVAARGISLADVDLGDVSLTDLGDAGEAIFALESPGVIGPLPSDLGPAIYRMNGVLAAENITFEEAREELAPEAAADRARRMIGEMIGEVEDLLAGGADPGLIAERTGLIEGTIEWNTDVFEDIAAYAGFRAAAQSTNPGDFGEVIELEDGGIVTLVVEDVQPPALIPLEEVRDDVIAAWTAGETEAALAQQAEALAQDLRDGREMAGMGLSLDVNRGLTRDGFVEGTPPDFLSEVFALEKDGVTVLSADGDAWLVRLDLISEADGTSTEAELVKARFARETAQSFSTAITNAFTQALVDETQADINQSAVNAVNAAAFLGAGGQHGGM